MINLDSYIVEKLKLDKDIKADNITLDIIAEKIYDELSKDHYNMKFPKKLQNNKHDASSYIYPIPANILKYYKEDLLKCFKGRVIKEYNIFRIAILNNGSLFFSDNPRYSQGDVVYHENNTNFVYYILNKDNECILCGRERKNYGQSDSIGKNYKFLIEL